MTVVTSQKLSGGLVLPCVSDLASLSPCIALNTSYRHSPTDKGDGNPQHLPSRAQLSAELGPPVCMSLE